MGIQSCMKRDVLAFKSKAQYSSAYIFCLHWLDERHQLRDAQAADIIANTITVLHYACITGILKWGRERGIERANNEE